MEKKKTVIVGGGAAGMMCAIFAARAGDHVVLMEKNEKVGKKIFITGKGRCNLTNDCEVEEFFRNVVRNPKFLYSAVYGFDNHMTRDFFEELGCKCKVERGERVFPLSDHSSDVIRALEREMNRLGVEILLQTKVTQLIVNDNKISGVMKEDFRGISEEVRADKVVVATGGASYPLTGSTGDGYKLAEETGHKIKPRIPALVPLCAKEEYIKALQGLSLKNVRVTVKDGKKKLYDEFGEMLFTHYGVSGPLILSASSYLGDRLREKELVLSIDLKPALSEEQLDKRILRDFDAAKNKNFANSLGELLPAKLIPVIIELSGIDPYKKIHDISKEERKNLCELLKNFTMTITALRSMDEAIITRGGIDVKDINPSTMESKKVTGLFFAGEIIDVDALTGGFNLQIAWSTGALAGNPM